MSSWESSPPPVFGVVTGFFPETSPKETWATNPRPLLVLGVRQSVDSGEYHCRVAYGTSKTNSRHAHEDDLVVANISLMDQLGLKSPTRFVISSGREMVIMPWTEEFFRPWSGKSSPFLSRLPADMQRYVAFVVGELDDLPQF